MTFPIRDVTAVDMAFGGAGRMDELLPAYADVPDVFKSGRTKWNQLFNDWFYVGVSALNLIPRDGIDGEKAIRHIRTVIGSFEPKHEHKEAGVAFLCSQWFTDDSSWTPKSRTAADAVDPRVADPGTPTPRAET